MTRRRTNKKQRLTQRAAAAGEEPPDPVTLTVLAVTGTVLAATGTAIGAASAHQNAQYQASMAQSNALAAQREADYARQQAAYNENLQREQAAKVRGAQRAAIGASGLDFSGSPLDLLEETAFQSEIEAQQIRRQGEFSAASSEFDAAGSLLKSRAYRATGNTQLTAGLVSSGGQLASGLTSNYIGYKEMKAAGTY